MHPTPLSLPAGFQLALTVLLAVVPVIVAIPFPSRPSPRGLHDRDNLDPNSILPYVEQGCHTNSIREPALTSLVTKAQNMTVMVCLTICYEGGFSYAGLQNGNQCFCGTQLTHAPGSTYEGSPWTCDVNCAGNITENCGGPSSLRLFWNGTPWVTPSSVQNVGPWKFMGCFDDVNNQRTLTVPHAIIGGKYNNTVQNCINACETGNYTVAGMRFAIDCWCDHQINQGRTPIDPASCMLPCPGNNLELCGGPDSLTIYQDESS